MQADNTILKDRSRSCESRIRTCIYEKQGCKDPQADNLERELPSERSTEPTRQKNWKESIRNTPLKVENLRKRMKPNTWMKNQRNLKKKAMVPRKKILVK